MGIKLIIEGENMDDIARLIQQAGFVGGVPSPAPVPVDEKPVSTEAKKPVGRPRKAPVEAPEGPDPASLETPDTPKVEEKPKPMKKYSLDDVRTALQDYAKKQDGEPQAGILKVRELLMTFKSVKGDPCQKISELQDADYPAVVARCAI